MRQDRKPSCVYLLHLDQPYCHARHYLGWSNQLLTRLREHVAGGSRSTALLQAVAEEHIGWRLVRLWRFPSVGEGLRFEARLKRQHASHLVCPVCHPEDFDPEDPLPLAVCDGQGHLETNLTEEDQA